MSDPEVTWVCCPVGVDAGHLRVAVVLAPRLDGAGTLADAAVLADWPARLPPTPLRLTFDPGSLSVAATASSRATSALWKAIFPARTPVRAFGAGEDPTQRPVVSYPSADVANALRSVYAESVVAGADRTDSVTRADTLLRADFDLGRLDVFREGFAAKIQEAHAAIARRASDDRGLVEVIATKNGAQSVIARAFAMQQAQPPRAPGPREVLDFHQVVATLGDHPALLRGLGLIVDLAVPIASLNGVVPTRMRLDPESVLTHGVTHVAPWTAVELNTETGEFAAKARGALAGGVWDISTPEFHLENLEVDGAVRQAVAMVSSPDSSDVGPAEPPALRNDGISLVRSGRAAELHGRLASAGVRRLAGADARANGDDLAAEDLLRGYRVDVWDDISQDFHCLHARRLRYTVDGFGPYPADGDVTDEGLFQESLTGDTELYVHERLLTWRGWSLSAPRPGTAAPNAESPPGDPDALAALHTHVKVAAAPGTLPRLRFGRTYRFRLRTVDLSGHSVNLKDAAELTTSELKYLRYEPVPPPVFAPVGNAAAFTPGESLHRMVIRRPVPQTDEERIGLPTAGPPSERLILPPRGSLDLAEQHGMLDDALGDADPARRAATRALLSRAQADLTYPVGEFAPYLPDPQALGVVFEGLPGVVPGEILPVLFLPETWDRIRPIRLRLAAHPDVAGPAKLPDYDGETRTLTAFLREGASCTVRVSSIPRDHALMALLQDSGARRTAEEQSRITDRAARGLHPMVTPYLELELVHAVWQPGYPRFQSELSPVRGVGEATVGVRTSISVDPRATDSVSLHATWIEHVDPGPNGPPEQVTRSDEVFVMRLAPDAAAALRAMDGDQQVIDLDSDRLGLARQQFPDTGFRVVSYKPVATSRFGDCYPPESLFPAAAWDSHEMRVLNSAVPPPPMVHSVVPSQLVGPQTVELPAGPPTGPVIPDTEPADAVKGAGLDFGGSRWTHARKGSGIRIYLERPWFVTGAEESVGVVLLDPSYPVPGIPNAQEGVWGFDPTDPRPQWFSQAGQDPIRRSHGVTRLTVNDFRNPDHVGTIGALADATEDFGKGGWEIPVTVLGYVPRFEDSSGLWYADIEVDSDKSYMPFFRLAIGRYQPNSLSEHVCMSRVSTIDFVQPLPTRTLTILRQYADPQIKVTLRGLTYRDDIPENAARVTARMFFAVPEGGDNWRAVEEVEELDLVRDPTDSHWAAKMILPPPQAGRVLRLLVVERDVLGAFGTDRKAERVVYVGTIDLVDHE